MNGLALMPLAWFGSTTQKEKWLREATSDPRGEYLAGWVVSEAAGAPGGTANFDHPGAHPTGIGLLAKLDKGRGEHVLNGTKYWPCNACGWDLKGANVNVCIVRTDPDRGGTSGLRAMLVPRGTPGVTYAAPISTLGHRLCQNNSITFDDCRVSQENAFAIGDGDLVISKAFTWSGQVATIAAVGVARSADEYVLSWVKSTYAVGGVPIIQHQAVGYLLADIAMKIEAGRAFSWKAAHGMQMRKIWGVMLDPDFDPRAISDSRQMKFKRSMEGAGLPMPLPDAGCTGSAKAAPRRSSRQLQG